MDNPNRMITKQDLADFYDTIYPYLGGMPEVLANKFDKANLYSTDEKIIGCFIDGKPIYQKTLNLTSLGITVSNTWAEHDLVDLTSYNIDNMISIKGFTNDYNGLGYWMYYPVVSESQALSAEMEVYYRSETKKLQFRCYRSAGTTAVTSLFVTLQYTKTTDSATSIGDESDYSTTEKIVGTWVTGAPIYQKTVMINTVPSSGNALWVQIEPTIDVVVDYSAIVYSDIWYSAVDSISTQDATSSSYFKVYVYNYKWTENPGCAVLINNIVTTGWDDKKAFITVKYTKKTS